MAISRDAFLGHGNAGAQAAVSVVTSAAAAAGTVLSFCHGYFNASGIQNPTITAAGGLTWTRRINFANGTFCYAQFTAVASAGLASGTTITSTGSSASSDNMVSLTSYAGVDTASPTGLSNTGGAATQAWATGSIAAAASSALVGAAFTDGYTGTSTPTGGATEVDDFNIAGQTETMPTEEKFSAGTTTLAGSWGDAGHTAGWACGAVELVAASAAATPPGFVPNRMPLGV